MRLIGTLFIAALAYLAAFAVCVYLCFGASSLWLCHRWTGCFEVSDGGVGFGYILTAPFAMVIGTVAGALAALVVIATMDRTPPGRNSD
jgi:hypothetical protein